MKEFLRRELSSLFTTAFLERPEYQKHVQCFNALVDFLRNREKLPDPDINRLTTLLWRLVGSKIVPTAAIPDNDNIRSLSFIVQKISPKNIPVLKQQGYPENCFLEFIELGSYTGCIILPDNFPELFNEDPAMQMGAVVFIASQVRDYITGRLMTENPPLWKERAYAYEAQLISDLLKMAQEQGKVFQPNDYQQEILRAYPKGLASLPGGG